MKRITTIILCLFIFVIQIKALTNGWLNKCITCKYYNHDNTCRRFVDIQNKTKRILNNPTMDPEYYNFEFSSIYKVRSNEKYCGKNAKEFVM